MTITKISDREIALQAQLAAMTASRDEYQQAADKMAMEHKIERDTLRQHIKHIGNDAMRSENHELRQQLAEAQALIEASRKQEPVAWAYEGEPSFDGTKWHKKIEVTTSFQVAKFKSGTIKKPIPLCAAPQAVPADGLHGCACRWDKNDKRIETCARHQGWLDVVSEWSDRAKNAEAVIAAALTEALAQPVREPLKAQVLHDFSPIFGGDK